MSLLSGLHKHHIVPRYRGGNNSPENLVLLHPIDHAITHLVRYKIYGNPADGWAFNRLMSGLKNELIPNLKGIPRPYMRKPMLEETKAKISQANKGVKKTPEAVEKMKLALTGRKAEGKSLEALHAHRHLGWSPEAQEKKSAKTKGVPRPYAKNNKLPEGASSLGGKAGKGRKQTAEQIAKRVASRRATLESQGRTK